MKDLILTGIFICFALMYSCKAKQHFAGRDYIYEHAADIQSSVNYMEPVTWLLGYLTRNRMSIPPHSEWFTLGYEEYQADTVALNQLKNIDKNDLEITIVLGTWCPDSRREVPRFMKVIDQWGYPDEKITFIGVDNQKIAPTGNYEELNIQRVPTFIFFKNNIEAGRIIEVPVTSLEQDMVNILSKE